MAHDCPATSVMTRGWAAGGGGSFQHGVQPHANRRRGALQVRALHGGAGAAPRHCQPAGAPRLWRRPLSGLTCPGMYIGLKARSDCHDLCLLHHLTSAQSPVLSSITCEYSSYFTLVCFIFCSSVLASGVRFGAAVFESCLVPFRQLTRHKLCGVQLLMGSSYAAEARAGNVLMSFNNQASHKSSLLEPTPRSLPPLALLLNSCSLLLRSQLLRINPSSVPALLHDSTCG